MPRRMSNARRVAIVVGTPLTMAAVMACSDANGDPGNTIHCVDGNNQIVDDDRCDNDSSSSFFFLMMPGHDDHRPGHRYSNLPPGHQRVAVNDQAGRSRIGLPSTGKVSTGAKFGGIGKGGVGNGGPNNSSGG